MTPPEFAPIWMDMLRAWPATREVDGTSRLYARKLAPFTLAEVAAVVDALILEETWMPPVAAIWQRCVDARDAAPLWEDAWAEAQEHAGADQAFGWSHEVIREAARAVGGLGLHEIRESTNPAAMRAQFRDAYQSMLRRRRREFATSARELPPPARAALEPSR